MAALKLVVVLLALTANSALANPRLPRPSEVLGKVVDKIIGAPKVKPFDAVADRLADAMKDGVINEATADVVFDTALDSGMQFFTFKSEKQAFDYAVDLALDEGKIDQAVADKLKARP